MSIHDELLKAARRLCQERGGWTFRLGEVVLVLPHLNERSVRTHVVSRCCVNAPKNHPHKWNYFRRLDRGVYEILPPYRTEEKPRRLQGRLQSQLRQPRVAEQVAGDATLPRPVVRDVIHAVAYRSEGFYVGECLEVAVVSQARTLDELVSNLQDAIGLHIEGDRELFGLTTSPRLVMTYEVRLQLDGTPN
jgi:predicted RNase H-like HicB family nuclease